MRRVAPTCYYHRMELQTIIFLGPQGSGKGTQVELLAQFLEKNDPARPTFHFSVGELLREFGLETGYTEARVHQSLLGGNMQPSFISSYLVARFFIRHLEGKEHLIIDGYPRSPENNVSFDSAMDFYGRKTPTLIYLTLPDEEAVTRLLKRGRNDDTEEGIRKRLAWTKEQFSTTIEHFQNNPAYRFMEVDGLGTIEEVHGRVLTALELA